MAPPPQGALLHSGRRSCPAAAGTRRAFEAEPDTAPGQGAGLCALPARLQGRSGAQARRILTPHTGPIAPDSYLPAGNAFIRP
jgi:hypothetical protein